MNEIGEFLQALNDNLGLILAAMTALGLIVAKFKGVFKSLRQGFKKLDNTLDVLGGRGPVLHPDNGQVVVPAVKPLNERLNDIEARQDDTSEALKMLARNQEEIIRLDKNLQSIIHKKEAEHKDIWSAIDALANK